MTTPTRLSRLKALLFAVAVCAGLHLSPAALADANVPTPGGGCRGACM
jgi:hypothetical protein